MIPKVINYCWFGGNPIPEENLRCIESWKKYCPDYEIKRWDESNYDVKKIKFTQQAYDEKKYAFVSDYSRLDIIYNYGGIYLDVDVEMVRNFDPLLDNKLFAGLEKDKDKYYIALGLGFGSEKFNNVLQEIMKYYENRKFKLEDGKIDIKPIPMIVTEILSDKYNLNDIENITFEVDGMTIYSTEYFGCKDMHSNEIVKTGNSYSIHHYNASWHSKQQIQYKKLTKVFGEKMGEYVFVILKKLKVIGEFK